MHQLADPGLIWQQCLFTFEEPAIDRDFATVTRTWLDDDSWIDYAPRWLHGADRIFAELIAVLPWCQREVTMYDRRLPEPRLTAWWNTAPDVEVLPVLADARTALTHHYARPFDSIAFNLNRDGHDSVAWHGDRERYELEDPTVVIVSTGQPRPFHLRPRGGGASRSWQLGHGDLFVMGGSCQHDWEHCVPKVAAAGPRLLICSPTTWPACRLSVTFRSAGLALLSVEVCARQSAVDRSMSRANGSTRRTCAMGGRVGARPPALAD